MEPVSNIVYHIISGSIPSRFVPSEHILFINYYCDRSFLKRWRKSFTQYLHAARLLCRRKRPLSSLSHLKLNPSPPAPHRQSTATDINLFLVYRLRVRNNRIFLPTIQSFLIFFFVLSTFLFFIFIFFIFYLVSLFSLIFYFSLPWTIHFLIQSHEKLRQTINHGRRAHIRPTYL